MADDVEAVAILEAFDGVDGEHGGAEGCMQFAELWFAQSCWTAFYDAGDDAADGVAGCFHLFYNVCHLGGFVRIGAAHVVGLNER